MEAPQAGPTRQFVSGYPPPPFYYKEYADKDKSTWRPPPKSVDKYFRVFQNAYPMEYSVAPLDSDTKLYVDSPGTDLREEFRRLYHDYVDQCMVVLDVIHNNRGGEVSALKKLTKLHKNLSHILLCLRYHEAVEMILARLETQLNQRRECVENMRRAVKEAEELLCKTTRNSSKSMLAGASIAASPSALHFPLNGMSLSDNQ